MSSFQSVQLRKIRACGAILKRIYSTALGYETILLWLYNIYFQVDFFTAKIYRNPAESQLVFNNIEVENINFLRSRFNKRNVKI